MNSQNLKLFPTKSLNVELEDLYSRSYEKLKGQTDLTDNLISTWTNKEFRGTVTEQGFKLISSEIGRGAVCVYIGNFQNNSGTIQVRLNKAFQILFGILLSYPIIGFGLLLLTEGFNNALKFIPILLLLFLFIRYVFMGLSFWFISKTGLKKLARTLNIKSLNNKV
ncbi:hypothetical protein [Fulvivirga sp.]|uniref:hypothetical protein n=1 Tax=Fulvivirga sp. TaxID=1931237 RepID=UPI0032EB1B16